MIRTVCKACPAEKSFFSKYNANDWMYRHHRAEHGDFPGQFELSDFFVIEGVETNGPQTIK